MPRLVAVIGSRGNPEETVVWKWSANDRCTSAIHSNGANFAGCGDTRSNKCHPFPSVQNCNPFCEHNQETYTTELDIGNLAAPKYEGYQCTFSVQAFGCKKYGDGQCYRGRQMSNIASVTVVVKAGSVPSVVISSIPPAYRINLGQDLRLKGTAACMETAPSNTIQPQSGGCAIARYQWTEKSGSLVLPISISRQQNLVVPAALMTGTYKDYTFRLNAWDSNGNLGQAQVKLDINSAPAGGDFVVTPTTGTALGTEFSLYANNWHDDNTPLIYYFSFCLGEAPCQDATPIAGPILNPKVEGVYLPQGLLDATGAYKVQLVMAVVDQLNGTTVSYATAEVSPAPLKGLAALLENKLGSLLADAERLEAFQHVFPVISTGASVMSSNPVSGMFDPLSTLASQDTLLRALGISEDKSKGSEQTNNALAAAQAIAASGTSLNSTVRESLLDSIRTQTSKEPGVISASAAKGTISAISSLSTPGVVKALPVSAAQSAAELINGVARDVMIGRLEGETVNMSSSMINVSVSRLQEPHLASSVVLALDGGSSVSISKAMFSQPSRRGMRKAPYSITRQASSLHLMTTEEAPSVGWSVVGSGSDARRQWSNGGRRAIASDVDMQLTGYATDPFADHIQIGEVASQVLSVIARATTGSREIVSFEAHSSRVAPALMMPILPGVFPLAKNEKLKCYVWDTSVNVQGWVWHAQREAYSAAPTVKCSDAKDPAVCRCQLMDSPSL